MDTGGRQLNPALALLEGANLDLYGFPTVFRETLMAARRRAWKFLLTVANVPAGYFMVSRK